MRSVHTGLYVVMGVSGAGKSLVGSRLARALELDFLEGHDLHTAENVRRVAAGIPLTDDCRRGWLLALASRIRESHRAGRGLVVACSALKLNYRDLLRSRGDAALRLVYLAGSRELLAERMALRRDHFMPPSLLESQLATLEAPGPDEGAWMCDMHQTPAAIVADIVARTARPT